MNNYDYIIVGSGINALVAAALLGKKGHKVLVLERNDRFGGCLRTEEITEPGFHHDVMATTMVMFTTSPGFQVLEKDLAARGLEFSHSDFPTGVLQPNGKSVLLSKNREKNISNFNTVSHEHGDIFNREMTAYASEAPLLFGMLGNKVWSQTAVDSFRHESQEHGTRELGRRLSEGLVSARNYLEATYTDKSIHALWAPWVLHSGLSPESQYSGEIIKMDGLSIEAAGCPVAKGGSKSLVSAFEKLIKDQLGTMQLNADVDRILSDKKGKASGVKLTNGQVFHASHGVICSTSPAQLYKHLLADWPTPLPNDVEKGVKNYRYGRGDMQIHYALNGLPKWKGNPDLAKVALLHITPGLDGVSRAVNEAERGLLPAEPTICLGQPTALDPTRAPDGKAIFWIQLLETPSHVKGDAAGIINTPADGCWTDNLRELYADRIEAILAKHIENFSEIKLSRRVYSPADLEKMNINLIGGDPYGGQCELDQLFISRPFKSTINHETHVPRLYHIGSSTHPGPGLTGSSGYILASTL